jgi:pyridinium-3,5-biscarboxylic acid mononucleotide sulfurtransferase
VNIESKYEALKNIVKELKTVLVAYSGGMDSTLLLKTCIDVLGNDHVVAFTGNAPTFPVKEIEEAKQIASDIGAENLLYDTEILKDKLFVENTKERCYHCKKHLLHIATEVAKEKNMACIVDGTNFDDTGDFRPGSAAVKEMGAISPLLQAELTKDDIKALSRMLSLPTYNKPPYACLATRVPYGTPIDATLLKQIELSEELIKSIGISQVRVRYHGNVARIEVMNNDLDTILKEQQEIVDGLKRYGFTYVSLDLEGYRTGSMNEI